MSHIHKDSHLNIVKTNQANRTRPEFLLNLRCMKTDENLQKNRVVADFFMQRFIHMHS